MTWLKIDDAMMRNPKIRALSAVAFRVHIAALCTCAEFSTDGYVSPKTARAIGAKGAVLHQLLDENCIKNGSGSASLWVQHLDGGFMIHDYLEYNPSKAEIAAGKQMRRDRAEKAAHARWDATSNAKSMAPSSDMSLPRPRQEDLKTDQEDSTTTDRAILALLGVMGETERSQAHLQLLGFRARGAGEYDFRQVTSAAAKKRPANPRAYVVKSLENRLRERTA